MTKIRVNTFKLKLEISGKHLSMYMKNENSFFNRKMTSMRYKYLNFGIVRFSNSLFYTKDHVDLLV